MPAYVLCRWSSWAQTGRWLLSLPCPSQRDSYLKLSVHMAEVGRQCCWAGRMAAGTTRLCHQSSCICLNGDMTSLGARTASCAAAKLQLLFTSTVLPLRLLHCSFVTRIFFKKTTNRKNSWNKKVDVNQACINIVLNPLNTQSPAYREGTWHNYWFQKFLSILDIRKVASNELKTRKPCGDAVGPKTVGFAHRW